MPVDVGIIADDLTGAADAAVAFARAGRQASVGFRIRHGGEAFPLAEGDALAYDTATRDMPSDEKRAIELAVRRAARRLRELEPRVVFKKIDSTLRGHLRWELEAVRLEFPDRLAVVCPAFPAQGRTVQSGVLHIHNVPWTATEFAPRGMFGNLTVRGAFGMEGDASALEANIGHIRQGVAMLEAHFQKWKEQGIQTVFCDAAQGTDLDILAQTLVRNPQQYLPVGSAGLARAIADARIPSALPALPLQTVHAETPIRKFPEAEAAKATPDALKAVSESTKETFQTRHEWMEPFHKGRVLVVVGSLHTASRRQAAIVTEHLNTPPVIVRHESNVKPNLERAVSEICRLYAEGQRVVVLTTPDAPHPSEQQDFAWMPGSVAWRVCLWGLQAGWRVDALAVCGGNTAIELAQAFGGTGLRLAGEWQPGVAVGRLIVPAEVVSGLCFDGLPLLTKAGGFGDEETLARCVGLM